MIAVERHATTAVYHRSTPPETGRRKTIVTAVSLKQCLQQADCDVFTNIAVLLKIACTLPVGSCEVERSFSCFRRIKSFLRNNMGYRVSGLALMNLNHEMEINLDIISGMFAQRTREECSPSAYCMISMHVTVTDCLVLDNHTNTQYTKWAKKNWTIFCFA